MIEAVHVIIEFMDELGWDIISEWENSNFRSSEKKLSFEQRPSEIPDAQEIENGIYFTPTGTPVKQLIVKDRTVSWKTDNGNKTVDLAEPGSLEEIVSYVSR